MVAGEPSGDLLGARLLSAMQDHCGPLDVSGIGGPQMSAQGHDALFAMERLSVMGLVQPLARLPELLSIRHALRSHWRACLPDLFVGIDAPDFNLPLERDLRREGVVTVHVVSPTVWAWRGYRTAGIARAADLLLTLFPFEAEYYRDTGVRAEFVGHPLADEYSLQAPDTRAARAGLELGVEGPVLALLPGSREAELGQHGPLFLAVLRRLRLRHPGLRCVMPAANRQCYQQLVDLLRQFPDLDVCLLEGRADEAIAAADTVLVASGTATLQALLLKKPMVIAWRMGGLTHAAIAPMLTVPWIGLPNLLAGRELVPEFVQRSASVEQLSLAVGQFLERPELGRELAPEYTRLHGQLRQDFGVRSARIINRLLQEKP